MFENEVLKGIFTRRSVREFSEEVPSDEVVKTILEAGIWAPSGLNNQPWRFIVVRDPETKEKISELTHYSWVVKAAPVLICVFMDLDASYHRGKDLMAMGACHENMLLAAHSLGLGGVWLGEILKRKDEVRKILRAPATWELTAVLAIGHPSPKERKSKRRPISEVAHKERYGEHLKE
jgi:nitroreductase